MNIYVYKSHNIRKKASKKLSFNYKAQKMLNIGFKCVYPPPLPVVRLLKLSTGL